MVKAVKTKKISKENIVEELVRKQIKDIKSVDEDLNKLLDSEDEELIIQNFKDIFSETVFAIIDSAIVSSIQILDQLREEIEDDEDDEDDENEDDDIEETED